jgi:hypothetical protein
MATNAKFARLAHYSCEFGEASHIFLKNGLLQMSASLASPSKTSWRMSASLASLASPSKTGWRMLASPAHFRKGHFGEHSNSLNLLASGHCIAYHLIKIAYLLWLYFVLCLSLILSFSYLVNLSVTISPFYLSYTLFLHILSFSLFPISILSYALLISTDCFSTNIFNKFIHHFSKL